VHIVAAGAWIGSLAPFLAVLAASGPSAAAAVSRKFSPIGITCVVLLAGSAVVLALLLVGSVSDLTDTDYGRVILIKLLLFVGLLACAATNRNIFTPALDSRDPGLAKRLLAWSVGIELLLGALAVFVAAQLASLPPGNHAHVMKH
jgi:putative copper export protein